MFGISATELRSYERGSTLISDSVLTRLFTYGYMLMIARKNIKRKEQDLLAAGVVVNWCGAECNHPPWRTGTGTTTLYGRCVAVRQEFYFR